MRIELDTSAAAEPSRASIGRRPHQLVEGDAVVSPGDGPERPPGSFGARSRPVRHRSGFGPRLISCIQSYLDDIMHTSKFFVEKNPRIPRFRLNSKISLAIGSGFATE